jgi:hypothetical protein
MILDLPDLFPSPGPLCMGACRGQVHGQYPQHETLHGHHLNYRHHLTVYNACWLTPTGLPRIWRVWPGTSHVETGEGVRVSH